MIAGLAFPACLTKVMQTGLKKQKQFGMHYNLITFSEMYPFCHPEYEALLEPDSPKHETFPK